jgi:signal transduction histidine kinase
MARGWAQVSHMSDVAAKPFFNLADGTEKGLDRAVLIMTLVIWAVYLSLMTTRSLIAGMEGMVGFTIARILLVILSIGLCWGLHLILRRMKTASLLRKTLTAFGLALPAAIVVSIMHDLGIQTQMVRTGELEAVTARPAEFAYNFVYLVWVIAAWTALYAALIQASAHADDQRRVAVAESSAQVAQLTALRFQLNPHFLFNALNAVSGLIGAGRAKQADEVVEHLSDFLRYSLKADPLQRVTLAEELDAQRLYLKIEKARFGDRLQADMACGHELGDVLVPNLVLQPLIENAVKYGVMPVSRPVTIEVRAERVGGDLRLSVRDDGEGSGAGVFAPGLGIGLWNTQRRLEALYGEQARLQAGPRPEGGWEASVQFPAERGASEGEG